MATGLATKHMRPNAPGAGKLLDAAETCIRRYGLSKTTIEDIAREAGSSRATFYRLFDNREALFVTLASREATSLAINAGAHIAKYDEAKDWIVEGMVFCLNEIPQSPLLSEFVSPESGDSASRLLLTSKHFLSIGSDLVRPMFEAAQMTGLIREELELDMLIEWAVRLLISFLSVPGTSERTNDDLRHVMRTMLLPAILKE